MNSIIASPEGNKMHLILSKSIYEKEAALAASYKFTDKCIVVLDSKNDQSLDIYFELKNNGAQTSLKEITQEFCNEILDQQLRLDLEKKYGSIRDLIVKQAFAPIIDSGNQNNSK